MITITVFVILGTICWIIAAVEHWRKPESNQCIWHLLLGVFCLVSVDLTLVRDQLKSIEAKLDQQQITAPAKAGGKAAP